MTPDPIGDRFVKKQKKDKLGRLARKARGTDEVEAEKELLDKSDKVEPIRSDRQPARNDPCPCGSGKKYKRCCGAGK